ncbi:MAG: SAM-dependent methyltransferase, partial [Calothrix sp. MO_167.B12]|nr:SAM-dependent methyltransferase [Calothrix sp. MO_167.B12]
HPQEIDYNVETVFELIDASGLDFVGFSNSGYWDIERLLGKAPELIERAKGLSDRQLYRLIELLDPEISHYEFFLSRPPLAKNNWSDDAVLIKAIPERHPCMEGWPGKSIFNYDYQVVKLSDGEFEFLQACDSNSTVGEILANVSLELDEVRKLHKQQLIMLSH